MKRRCEKNGEERRMGEKRLQIVRLPCGGILLMRYASSQNLNYFQTTPPNILNILGVEDFCRFQTFDVRGSALDCVRNYYFV